jgi:Na+/glutamate symporter
MQTLVFTGTLAVLYGAHSSKKTQLFSLYIYMLLVALFNIKIFTLHDPLLAILKYCLILEIFYFVTVCTPVAWQRYRNKRLYNRHC